MWYLCAAGIVVAFGGLVWARYVTSDSWRYGLLCVGLGAGLALSTALAGVLRRFLDRPWWKGLAAAVVGTGAVFARLAVHFASQPPPGRPPPIVLWKVLAESFQYVGGAVSLILGSLALWECIDRPAQDPAPTGHRLNLTLSAAGIAAALYGLSPLTLALGIPMNHWTFLALVAAALLTFAATAVGNRLIRRPKPDRGLPKR